MPNPQSIEQFSEPTHTMDRIDGVLATVALGAPTLSEIAYNWTSTEIPAPMRIAAGAVALAAFSALAVRAHRAGY